MAQNGSLRQSTHGHGDAGTELAVLQGHDADLVEDIAKRHEDRPRSQTTDTVIEYTDGEHKMREEGDLETGRTSSTKSGGEAPTTTPQDANTVDWEGPEDPQNPMNWAANMKWVNVAVISSITFITLGPQSTSTVIANGCRPLASSMFAPGVPQVMDEFNSTNINLASFVVSVYVLGYAFGPIVIAPLSELYGRLPLYHACNALFVVMTVACAVSSNLNMLIGFRFLEGTFGSAPLTLGGGTIADMIIQEKRGGVMAIWAMGPLMGPVIGPIAGGYLSEARGWRWVFWVIAIVVRQISRRLRTYTDMS